MSNNYNKMSGLQMKKHRTKANSTDLMIPILKALTFCRPYKSKWQLGLMSPNLPTSKIFIGNISETTEVSICIFLCDRSIIGISHTVNPFDSRWKRMILPCADCSGGVIEQRRVEEQMISIKLIMIVE